VFNSNQDNSEVKHKTKNKLRKKNPKPELNKVQPWPQISYFGFVKNHGKSTALCLLQINGRTSKVSQGNQSGGVYVSTVFKDSVHLVYAGEERTFIKR